MKKVVIITGALGFIGQNVSKVFKRNGYYVIGIGHGKASKEILTIIGIDRWYEASIKIDALTQIPEIANVIVHCAGGSTVGASFSEPHLDYHKTVSSTLEVMEFMRLFCPQASFIYLSSAAVYGAKEDKIIQEDDVLTPVSPYGFHKLSSEYICKSYSTCFGLKVAIVRLFSIYGEGLRKQLLWDACNKMSIFDKKIEFYGDGEETRDWLHVLDAARLIYQLANQEFNMLILNGAYGKRIPVKEVINLLKDEMEKPEIEIFFNKHHKEGDPKYYHADVQRILETGWRPEIDLSTGIKEYVKWYKNLSIC